MPTLAESGGRRGREEREGKTEIQKIEYLKNEKRFLDEIKNIFHIAGTSFKL